MRKKEIITEQPTLSDIMKADQMALDNFLNIWNWGKDELKIPFNGKDHIIPVTMHKVKNKLEVNCATVAQDDKSSVSDQISQEAECDEDKNVPLEKWCAPVNFSLDSTTLKKNA
ncbi:19265_t:CDS:2 [Entrophospora sp. SA101]|nr:19265_t:CDS:2 [Entrophospora sp. SA101]